MTQDVVTLVLRPEIDPCAFVLPFTSLPPLAMVGLLIAASAGWVLPMWRHGVVVAAVMAPASLFAYGLPPWYLPFGIIAALNAVHFFVVLAVCSMAFGLKQLIARRNVLATKRRS